MTIVTTIEPGPVMPAGRRVSAIARDLLLTRKAVRR